MKIMTLPHKPCYLVNIPLLLPCNANLRVVSSPHCFRQHLVSSHPNNREAATARDLPKCFPLYNR